MERSFQSQSPETRTRVLEAAAELFASRGFAGTSISEIRKASGASASSIYWEFGSKEGVFGAVLEDAASRWLGQTRQAAELTRDQATGAGTMALAFDLLASELTERPEFLRLLLLLALERREGSPQTLDTIRSIRARASHGLARAFRVNGFVGPEVTEEILRDIAAVTLAFADGAFVAAQIDPGTADLRRMFAIFSAGLQAALGVEGAAPLRPTPVGVSGGSE